MICAPLAFLGSSEYEKEFEEEEDETLIHSTWSVIYMMKLILLQYTKTCFLVTYLSSSKNPEFFQWLCPSTPRSTVPLRKKMIHFKHSQQLHSIKLTSGSRLRISEDSSIDL